MKNIYLTSAYLAPIEYYAALLKAETVYQENCDYYIKQTYRNRCNIAAANGTMTLSIPIEKNCAEKVLTRDIRISDHNNWQNHHWRSIESAYNSTPFFEYYKDDLMPFYEKKWEFLYDFNWEIQQKILYLLDFLVDIKNTETYATDLNNGLDLREEIHPKKTQFLNIEPYYQVFDQKLGFISGLSIIDLLFNMGNESLLILDNVQWIMDN